MAAVGTAGRRALVAAAVAAALLAGAGGAVGSAAARGGPEDLPGNWMYTAVVEGEDPVEDLEGDLLRCPSPEDAGGPAPSEACERLKAVDGDITKIPRADVTCPMDYRPVTALAYGRWDGRRMAFAKTYPNACVLDASTGTVFKPA